MNQEPNWNALRFQNYLDDLLLNSLLDMQILPGNLEKQHHV